MKARTGEIAGTAGKLNGVPDMALDCVLIWLLLVYEKARGRRDCSSPPRTSPRCWACEPHRAPQAAAGRRDRTAKYCDRATGVRASAAVPALPQPAPDLPSLPSSATPLLPCCNRVLPAHG